MVGVLLRLFLAPFTSWVHDDSSWWWATTGGIQHILLYRRLGFPYPPVWGYLLQSVGWVLRELGATPTALGTTNLRVEPIDVSDQFSLIITAPLFNLVFKSILFLFDLGTALLLHHLTLRLTSDARRARLAFCLWFLNPFVIYETAVFGAFDVIVAFTVLASLVLLLNRRVGWAGALLALAVLTKLSPVMLVPLFVAFIATGCLDLGMDARRATRRFLLGAGGACVVVLVPTVLTHQLSIGLHAVLARTNDTPAFGGISIFGLLSFRGTQFIGEWLRGQGQLSNAVLLLQVASSVAIAFSAVRMAKRNPVFTLIGSTGLVLAAVVLLGPVANSQYELWFLPEIIILIAVWRRGQVPLALTSIAGLVYVNVVAGPLAVLYPLAQFTGILNVSTLTSIQASWLRTGTAFWSVSGSTINFVGPLSVMAVVAVAVLLRDVLWRPKPRRSHRFLFVSTPPFNRRLVVATSAMLAALLVGELVVAASPSQAQAWVAVSLHTTAAPAPARGSGQRPTTVDATTIVRPGASLAKISLAALPVTTAVAVRSVDVYLDQSYPVVETSPQTMRGVWDQLSGQLRLVGYHGSVRAVDASQLETVLDNTADARSTAIVDMSGILPDMVFSTHHDLVKPWIEGGGTLFWGGPPIGQLTGQHGQPSNAASYPGSLGVAGVARFIHPRLFGPITTDQEAGTIPSPWPPLCTSVIA